MARKLHIGGQHKAAGWEILNIQPAPYVDHVGNAANLSQFADATFSEVYASHVLEHLDFTGQLQAGIKEWYRVLEPGGRAYISVPDMDILARLFLEKDRFTTEERFFVMCMMFGGHSDQHDYHVVGLNEEFLSRYLNSTGFEVLSRVQEFGIFQDTSCLKFKDVLISLNMIALKPI